MYMRTSNQISVRTSLYENLYLQNEQYGEFDHDFTNIISKVDENLQKDIYHINDKKFGKVNFTFHSDFNIITGNLNIYVIFNFNKMSIEQFLDYGYNNDNFRQLILTELNKYLTKFEDELNSTVKLPSSLEHEYIYFNHRFYFDCGRLNNIQLPVDIHYAKIEIKKDLLDVDSVKYIFC